MTDLIPEVFALRDVRLSVRSTPLIRDSPRACELRNRMPEQSLRDQSVDGRIAADSIIAATDSVIHSPDPSPQPAMPASVSI